MKPLVSVVIRTLNEQRYLKELLIGVSSQSADLFEIEIVIVDSGSTDDTLKIAQKYNSRIAYINKEDFTFGRSLNIGCEFASGEYLVFVSGHCIPCDNMWIESLISPIHEGHVDYTYGRQLARDTTKFSEGQIFKKYFPEKSRVPQEGFFCNNANAAIRRSTWEAHKFNESLTGLEDMYLAKEILKLDKKIGYVANASVFHIHDESWKKVRIRYEREAIALQEILPELHFGLMDFLKCFVSGVKNDLNEALKEKRLIKEWKGILLFRLMQYFGAYRGNHEHRYLSKQLKYKYFYPTSDIEK